MRRNTIRKQGFTLVEMIIAVSIVILISALSIHSLLQAKITANEAAAIKNLRTLQTAFESYRTVNPTYPGSLTALGSDNPPYIDSNLAQGAKQGYNFNIVDTQANTFQLAAVPLTSGVTGNRSFYIDQGGEITEDTGAGSVAIGSEAPSRPTPSTTKAETGGGGVSGRIRNK